MKQIIIAISSILFLTGCQKEMSSNNLLQSNLASKNSAEKNMVTRPMYVNFYGTPNINLPPVECIPVVYGVSLGGGFFIHGTSTHLGLINPENSWSVLQNCILGPGPNQVTTHQQGQIEAADRDLLYFSSEEVTSFINGAFSGNVTLTGGTGRFTNATGAISITGTVNFQTGVVTWTGNGTINY